jgi:hypothetical protein
MADMENRLAAAFVAMFVSTATLLSLSLFLAGFDHVGSLLSAAMWHILIISIVAAFVRLLFRRGGLVLSAVCGALIAIAGFLIVWTYAVLRL